MYTAELKEIDSKMWPSLPTSEKIALMQFASKGDCIITDEGEWSILYKQFTYTDLSRCTIWVRKVR